MKKSAILKLTALIVLLLALIAVALTVAFYRPVTMKDPVKFRVGSYEAAVEIKKGDAGYDELQKTIEKTTATARGSIFAKRLAKNSTCEGSVFDNDRMLESYWVEIYEENGTVRAFTFRADPVNTLMMFVFDDEGRKGGEFSVFYRCDTAALKAAIEGLVR